VPDPDGSVAQRAWRRQPRIVTSAHYLRSPPLPHPPAQNLTYTVASNVKRGEVATLLSDVTGYFDPRRMSALMVGLHGGRARAHARPIACTSAARQRRALCQQFPPHAQGRPPQRAAGAHNPCRQRAAARPLSPPSPSLPKQGPSGSGKTTLLDLMAGRKTMGKTQGEVLFAGNKPTRPFLRRYTGYVSALGAGPRPRGEGGGYECTPAAPCPAPEA
jgi:hypothetical protein